MSAEQPEALLVSPDLFFTSRITGTAASVGLSVSVAPNGVSAAEMLGRKAYCCVLVDLAAPGLNVAELLAAFDPATRPRVVAFGPHVHDLRLREAEEAGCDEVLTRGQFSASLVDVLRHCARL